MERLTTRCSGYAVMAWEHEEKHTTQEWIDMLTDRLAAYEDSGLAPEEIERIVDAYGRGHTLRSESAERLEIVREIKTDRLRELVQAEQDGRLVVLPEPLKRAIIREGGRCFSDFTMDDINNLLEAWDAGRLVVLDEPRKPLVWGDDNHDSILCPNCGHDLMGGFPEADSCETPMYQCPYCGQPIEGEKAMTREEADAALAGNGGDGNA